MRSVITSLVIALCSSSTLSSGQACAAPLPAPEPRYEVNVERAVMVPMRDGIRLSTDVYRPQGVDQKLGAILIRLPYGKNRWYRPDRYKGAWLFAQQGFAVVVQDMRGTYQSEGSFTLGRDETDDANDTLDWIAEQPWSNGNVGGYGCSYMASTQHQLASTGNPHFKAMVPQAAFGADNGGAQGLTSLFGWARSRGSAVYLSPPPGAQENFWAVYGDFFDPAPKLPSVDPLPILRSLPVIDMMKKAKSPPNDYETFIRYYGDNPRAEATVPRDLVQAVARIPTLHMNSWYDAGVAQTLALFSESRKLASETQAVDHYAIIGPGQHCVGFFLGIREHSENTIIGERNVGDARFDFWSLYLRWFDHLLNEQNNGVMDMPRLRYYLMGMNQWRSAESWPLPDAHPTKYYLDSHGQANSRLGDGTLHTAIPYHAQSDEFIYNPGSPVPTLGGQVCGDCLPAGAATEGDYPPAVPDGAFDQSQLELRPDILVYSTPPLDHGVEVTGNVKVVLYASSSAADTDYTAKLVDVYPDGRAYNLTEGIIRARMRNAGVIDFLKPGDIGEFHINLQATSNWFGPGHRIRLEISSSNFPRFDRNLNTGGNNYDETEWKPATNTIYHTKTYPSHILLPIIAAEDKP